ncbi:MAG: phosphoribosylamine--glycine ligase [Defluviitaleaceae bacterium]|nr:phosphoribosylamine--glycine ligase [Defluviitaleaceae bacterium]
MSKVLIIGSGGREHALVWKLAQSSRVDKIFVANGNLGMEGLAECVDLAITDFAGLAEFAKTEGVALTIVGPEVPLVDGIVDFFEAEGLSVFGPRANAAVIEGSKSFAKELMKKYAIPTAAYEVFTDYVSAVEYIKTQKPPFVLKADGLAQGKGVVIAATHEEAEAALSEMLESACFGDAGKTVVIEEFLDGVEFSYMAFVNGAKVFPMVIAKDHKRAYDGDEGPNTGGMGAYSPVPQISEEMLEAARREILIPTAEAMVKEGRSFTGILYAGLIATADGAKVIEFNARFGDPETEVVLPRLESDLFSVIMDILAGESPTLEWSNESVLGIILASKGYPNKYETGFPITGLNDLEKEIMLFHCGTDKSENGEFVTKGGRVLLAACKGETLEAARNALYSAVPKIKCENLFYRTDIGGDL